MNVVAEFAPQIYMLGGNGDCDSLEILLDATAEPCENAPLTSTLARGTYWFWVGPAAYSGIPCGVPYVMTISGYVGVPAPIEQTTWGSLKALFR